MRGGAGRVRRDPGVRHRHSRSGTRAWAFGRRRVVRAWRPRAHARSAARPGTRKLNTSDVGATMTMRGRKPRPGRITYVGSGPGDPGLLTTRAATVLANAALVFTDPDVPEPVLALIGKDLPPVSGPAPANPVAANADGGAQGT